MFTPLGGFTISFLGLVEGVVLSATAYRDKVHYYIDCFEYIKCLGQVSVGYQVILVDKHVIGE